METSGRASQKRNMPSTRERWSDEPKLTSSYCCTVPDWLKPLGWRLCGGWWGWWRHRLLWGVERLFLLQGQDTNNLTIKCAEEIFILVVVLFCGIIGKYSTSQYSWNNPIGKIFHNISMITQLLLILSDLWCDGASDSSFGHNWFRSQLREQRWRHQGFYITLHKHQGFYITLHNHQGFYHKK